MLVGAEDLAQSTEFAELTRLHDNLLKCIYGTSHQDGAQLIAACRALAPPALHGLYEVLAEQLPTAASAQPVHISAG